MSEVLDGDMVDIYVVIFNAHIYTYTCICIHMHTHIHICIYIYIYIYIYAYVNTWLCGEVVWDMA